MRGERENFLRTDEVLAVPSLAFSRSWRDSPTVRSRGNNLIGLRSQPPVPRRRFIPLPPCRLSFSFSPSRALVILSRLTPRVEDRRPRIECPLVKLDPYHDPFLSELLISTARRGWLYRTEWRFPFVESGRDHSHFSLRPRRGGHVGPLRVRMGHSSLALKSTRAVVSQADK